MITAAVIVGIVGLILYLPSINPKVNEVGRVMFFCGLLAWLLNFTKPLL